MEKETRKEIEELLKENKIILFMKGEPNGDMCGFSSRVVGVLQNMNVDFFHFNVLEDESIWSGIKEYGNWPTIPQLYVQGKLIGGCDIVEELFRNGELKKILKGTSMN